MKNKVMKVNTNIYLRTILILIPLMSILLNCGLDNDFWFTINQGRYVLSNGFPTTLISTVHEGLSFVYQSWGTGVLFYLIYKYFGEIGMMIFLILIAQVLDYFFYKLCYTISNNKTISYLLTIFFIISLSLFFLVTRPHMFTILNLTIILYLLEKYIKEDKIKYLIPIPIIGLLEANMHGIYLLPLMIILSPYIINSFKFKLFKIESDGYRKKPLIITYIITFLAGFINPYTYKTIFYGLKSYTSVMKKYILELNSPDVHSAMGAIIIGIIFSCYLIYYIKKEKMPLRYYLLILGTTYMALDAIKSTPFFLIGGIFPIAYLFKQNKPSEIKTTKSQKIITTSLVIVTSIVMILCIRRVDNNELSNVVKYLNKNNTIEKPKVFTNFWNGSFLEYNGYDCYLDPRGEVFLKVNNKKEDILIEYINLQYTSGVDYNKFLEKYNFDYLLIDVKKDTLYYYLRYYPNDLYELVYQEKKFEIWKKKTTSN